MRAGTSTWFRAQRRVLRGEDSTWIAYGVDFNSRCAALLITKV